MQTAMLDTCEALLAMLDLDPAADDTIRVDVFDEWHNPDAGQAFSWVCYNRTCHNKSDVTDLTALAV
jgi:hypothetical protein